MVARKCSCQEAVTEKGKLEKKNEICNSCNIVHLIQGEGYTEG